jgi:PKD repeat protein
MTWDLIRGVGTKKLPVRLFIVGVLLLMCIQFYGQQARALPNASFTFSPIDPLVSHAITFTVNGTTSSGTSYNWDFGDGGINATALSTITHTYGAAGNYTVVLTVNSAGAVATLTRFVVVYASIPLTASFSVKPTPPVVATPVMFDATSSSDPNGKIVSYIWNFGDGSKNSTTSPVTFHEYSSAPRGFNATLIIIDDNGSNSSYLALVYVLAKLTVGISYNTSQGTAPLTVSFNAAALGGAGNYAFAWTLGDGQTGLGQSLSHDYTVPGTYQVQVTAADSAGHLAFSSMVITVENSARLEFGPIPMSYLLSGVGVAVLGMVILLLVYGFMVRRARQGQQNSGPKSIDPYSSKRRAFARSLICHGYDLNTIQNTESGLFR